MEILGDVFVSVLFWIFIFVWKTAIFWVPFGLAKLTFFLWHHYVSEQFIGGIEWAVLEVQIPREMKKTPLAMELFLTNALYHMSMKGGWESYWQGAVHFWYSLELVSIDGNVHFFIRVPSRIKKLVETQLYSQFPQVRIIEVEDYTLAIPEYKNDGDWYMWGCDFELEKHDAFSIKTYKEFGLDKPGLKEEEKVDPMTPVIEFLAALDRGEQVWLQIIIRQTEKMYHTHGTLFGHHDFYTESELTVDKVLEPYKKSSVNAQTGKVGTEIRVPPTIESEVEAAIDKSSKLCFDTGIRLVVLGDKSKVSLDAFNTTRRASRLLFRQYAEKSSNELVRKHSTQYDSTWVDPAGVFIQKLKHQHLTYYKLRTLFYPPILKSFKRNWLVSYFLPSNVPNFFVLSTEEIATIYHFPGLVSEAPTFRRLESKTSKPPANLPM